MNTSVFSMQKVSNNIKNIKFHLFNQILNKNAFLVIFSNGRRRSAVKRPTVKQGDVHINLFYKEKRIREWTMQFLLCKRYQRHEIMHLKKNQLTDSGRWYKCWFKKNAFVNDSLFSVCKRYQITIKNIYFRISFQKFILVFK